MTSTPALMLGVFSLLVALTSLLYNIGRGGRTDSTATENRLASLETKVDLFWRNVSVDAAKILHSPDPAKARQDYLLEQFMAETITIDEVAELVELLETLLSDHDSRPGDRLAASVVLNAVTVRYAAVNTSASDLANSDG